MSDNKREPRSTAEWVSFAVALAILLGVVGLIVAQAAGGQRPPLPVVSRDGAVTEKDGRWSVPVKVENKGDETAESVQVIASLKIGDETTEADQVVDFVSGGEQESLVFVFDDDPSEGELEFTVTGFRSP